MRLTLFVTTLILISLITPIFSSFTTPNLQDDFNYYYTIYNTQSNYQSNFTVYYINGSEKGNVTISYTFSDKIIKFFVSVSVAVFKNSINLKFNTTIPNLIQVIGESSEEKAIIWARVTNGSINSISTSFLLINGSGKLTFQFANGSEILSKTVDINKNSQSFNFTLALLSVNKTSTMTFQIENISPIYFSPPMYFKNYSVKQNVFGHEVYVNESPSITFIKVNNQYVLPSIIYVGKNESVSGFTLVMYGINSTVLGYVYNIYSHSVNKFFSLYEIKYPTVIYNFKYTHLKVNNYVVILGYNQSNVVIFLSNNTIINNIKITYEHDTIFGILFMINVKNLSYILVNGSVENVTVGKPIYYSYNLYTKQGNEIYETEIVIVSFTSRANYTLLLVNVNGTVVNIYNSNFKPINGSFFKFNSTTLAILLPYSSSNEILYLVYSKELPTTITTLTSTITKTATSAISTSYLIPLLIVLMLILGPIIVLTLSKR